MELRRMAIILAVLVLCASMASAGLLIDGAGDNSGWLALPGGATTGIHVIDVDLVASTVSIWIDKDFGPPAPGEDEVKGTVDFIQMLPDGQTVQHIVIDYERMTNSTGAAWGWRDFRWDLTPTTAASVNPASWDTWDISPFTTRESWTSATTDTLRASDGVVLGGADFTPGLGGGAGDLVIDVDLGASGSPVSLTFIQTATPELPEPGCLVFFMAGAGFVLRRRKLGAPR